MSGYWILRGKGKRCFCWHKHRQPDGKFYVWTLSRTGERRNVVACARKRTAEKKALARHAADLREKVNVGYIPKGRVKQLAAFRKYSEVCRERGKDDQAVVWEMKSAALEQDLKDNPEPVVKPQTENEIAIERVQDAIRRWERKRKLAMTKLKKLNRKLARLVRT